MQVEDIKEYSTKIKRTEEEIAKGIIGQRNVIHHILLAILADGNVLLEGVPGLGKTQLVKTLAKVMDLNFSRIQFTPDLMPTDITGTNLIIKPCNTEDTVRIVRSDAGKNSNSWKSYV